MALMDKGDAHIYGFHWGNSLSNENAPIVQAARTTELDRGKKGVWRVLTIHTAKDDLDIYVSPTGRTRVYRKGKGELVVFAFTGSPEERLLEDISNA